MIDLIFRKQITNGCIQIYNNAKSSFSNTDVFNALKYIRDKDTESKRKNESYKVDERRLKMLRKNIDVACGVKDWREFCSRYVGSILENEWTMLEPQIHY
ncbi:MAG: hypothetical protein A2622_00495 [Bdellovibrionales bacterium RIFCSPHIGHO2_01_FULL_40_29]|nr:MAG: hypothetical protein A2622_00495 [Bdellovibrionales bacterium RIFCSPHIGHO2_01_FULL_40_29]OFZ32602.1 MAG: hypothetical protein A3D17_05095 [Bdellovibrionales bacterium RIFCSPHIGHO2_02_FULL_40_15]